MSACWYVRPRRYLLLAALLLAAAVFVMSAPQSTLAAGPEEYATAIDRLIVALDRDDDPGIAAAVATLRTIKFVSIDGAAPVQPDLRDLLHALDQSPPDRGSALTRARAIRAALAASTAPTTISASEVEQRLRVVLARPELQPARPPNPILAELDRLAADVWTLIDSGLRAVFRSDAGRVLLAVIGLAVIGLLAYWVPRQIAGDAGRDAANVPGAGVRRPRSAEELRAEAERSAERGEYRAAIATLYLATLRHWEESGRLRFDRALTNREVLAIARASGDDALATRLEPLVRRFDRFWYTGRPGSSVEYEVFRRLAVLAWGSI